MNPRPIVDADLAYWADQYPHLVTFTAPPGMPECEAAQALVTQVPETSERAVRIPWQLDEIDLAHLAQGGTLWLSTWGGLPPHMLEVAAPPPRAPGDLCECGHIKAGHNLSQGCPACPCLWPAGSLFPQGDGDR